MQNRPLLAAAASAALFTLPGCNNQPVTLNAAPDPQAEALKNAAPLNEADVPPSVTASKAYRCSDNSLFYVDFNSNHTAVIRRGTRQASPTTLTAEGGNPPFTANGYSLSGDGNNVTINGKSCHV